MILTEINLQSFRNFSSFKCSFDEKFTIFLAPNSSGKTNLLEAIYFALSGEGFRESREIELINYNSARPATGGVDAHFVNDGGSVASKIALVATDTTVKKAFFVNGARVSHPQYMQEQTRAVLFAPSQIELLTGTPEKRRTYLNTLLSSYDIEYKKRLINYENALRKRNKILEAAYGGNNIDSQLIFWNEYMIEQAAYISAKRAAYVDFINTNQTDIDKSYVVVYRQNTFTAERLTEYKELESRICKTVIGPQKDDIEIRMGAEEKNVATTTEQEIAHLTKIHHTIVKVKA